MSATSEGESEYKQGKKGELTVKGGKKTGKGERKDEENNPKKKLRKMQKTKT